MGEAAVSVRRQVSWAVIGRAKESVVCAARQGSPEQTRNALGMLYRYSDSVCYRVSQLPVQQVNPVNAILAVDQHMRQMEQTSNPERQMARSLGLELVRDVQRETQKYATASVNQPVWSKLWHGIWDTINFDRKVSAVRSRVAGTLYVLTEDTSK